MKTEKIHFNRDGSCDFLKTLRDRVSLYFQENNKSPKAVGKTYLKVFLMFSFLGSFYALLLSGIVGVLGVFAIYSILGLCIAIANMNVIHDALHGSWTSHPLSNRLLGFIMDVFGTSSFYWKKEHTVDHHTFTNIKGHDADLDTPILLRLCPEDPYRKYHRFQQWYAPLLYSLNLIRWVFVSDTRRIIRAIKDRKGSIGKPSRKELSAMIILKLLHFTLFLVLPFLMLPYSIAVILPAYLCMLALGGLTVTVIFQLAHIVEHVAFPMPSNNGALEYSFAKHQISTTANFGSKKGLSTFLFGGLNFQVEHHLFPHICHTHLPLISDIVRKTAAEFGMTYHHHKSLFAAVKSHFKTLRRLGASENLSAGPILKGPAEQIEQHPDV